VLRQCYAILKPHGVLVLNLPAFECLRGQHDSAVGIQKRFRSGEVRSLLEQTGFDLLSVSYWNSVLFLPILVWRWLSRLADDGEPRSDLVRTPRWLNAVLTGLLRAEVTMAQYMALPLGSSLFLVGQKRG
jgi:hypothetical protein